MTSPTTRLELALVADAAPSPASPEKDGRKLFVLAEVIVWRDIRFTIVWGGPNRQGLESSSTWMNFRIYEIHSFDEGERPLYDFPGENPGHPFPDVTKALPAFSGFIKWDGCMQWQSSNDFQFHVDERDGIERMAEALQRVRDLMRESPDSEVEDRPNARGRKDESR